MHVSHLLSWIISSLTLPFFEDAEQRSACSFLHTTFLNLWNWSGISWKCLEDRLRVHYTTAGWNFHTSCPVVTLLSSFFWRPLREQFKRACVKKPSKEFPCNTSAHRPFGCPNYVKFLCSFSKQLMQHSAAALLNDARKCSPHFFLTCGLKQKKKERKQSNLTLVFVLKLIFHFKNSTLLIDCFSMHLICYWNIYLTTCIDLNNEINLIYLLKLEISQKSLNKYFSDPWP